MSKILLPAIILFSIINNAYSGVTGEVNPCQTSTYTYTLAGETCLPVQWSTTSGTVYSTGNKYVVNVVFSSTGSQSVTALTLGQAPGCNTYLETLYVNVKIKPGTPTLTKSSSNTELCTGESWTLTASLSGYSTSYGYDWFTVGAGTLLLDGSTGSESSPLHTTNNQVTLTPGSAYATCAVYVRMNNYIDCPSAYAAFNVQLGPYSNSQFVIYGPSSACPNSGLSFTPSLSGYPVTGYAWSAPSGWSPSTSSSQNFYTNSSSTFYGGVITLQLQNRCGWTGSPATQYLSSSPSCSGGGYYRTTASPNPASESISITPTEESGLLQLPLGTIVQLYDGTGSLVKTAIEVGGLLSLDVRNVTPGLYYVKVLDGLQITTKQVQVVH
jgi:hypothetical protein